MMSMSKLQCSDVYVDIHIVTSYKIPVDIFGVPAAINDYPKY
jgi:hypothetical protein